MHLVGLVIRMYHNARSSERQTHVHFILIFVPFQ